MYLKKRCKVTQASGTDPRYKNTKHREQLLAPCISFNECNISANGLKISNSYCNTAHKSLIRTEIFNRKGAIESSLKCQGYCYENDPAAIDAAGFFSQR